MLSLRLSIVEDNDDLFTADNQDNADSQESPASTPFNIDDHHPDAEYNNAPMETGTNNSLELYEVKDSPKGITLLYRQSNHDGIASENYQFRNGNQKFVLQSWLTRFNLKLTNETFEKDLLKQMNIIKADHAKNGTRLTAIVEKQAGETTLYNINSRRSAQIS